MKLVLLSGGSGKRLWPLSNDARSKQFLKLLKNKEGNLESMVQRVWGQLSAVDLSEASVIATSKSQVDMIQSQIGHDVPLVIEPVRRDTFPAIALAATYLHTVKKVNREEAVAILPVDPYVEDRFFQRVKELEKVLLDSGADLALMGVTPTYPSEKYGYIIPQVIATHHDYLTVDSFKEKPSEDIAKELITKKALWNCGVFAFKLGFILSLLENRGLPTEYDKLLSVYHELPKISFDYEVVEKANHIVALPYDGYWKDLGTWNTLTEEVEQRLIGKGMVSNDCENTHVINELDIPVTVLGLSNVVVAVSPDGILLSDKAASPRIKDMVKDFDQRPMFEERRWGWYRVLDHTKVADGTEVLTKRIGVASGKNLSYQLHYKRSEVWTIISGIGEFALNDKIFTVKAGDVLQIPVGSKHGIKAITDIEFIEVQTGTDLVEEDIVRIFMTWEEVEEHCQTVSSSLQEIAATKE
ncbi:sugar phosphate nucleotidyltransferase [Brevibacillus sp. 179-C9.3 HS]|uniref:sugar phosphate nucleotidyltransferase n=1 Tax=unclassified Brevibacillus TaxID=2684853 RepID=UPI00399F79E0